MFPAQPQRAGTLFPGSTGGRHWHAGRILGAVCHSPPAAAVPSAAPVLVPETKGRWILLPSVAS